MRGSVVEKPRGSRRWYVVFDLEPDGSGRRRQKWHSGYRTRRDAHRGLVELLAAAQAGSYVPPSRLRLGQFLTERWLPAIEPSVRPTTFAGYARHVRLYLVPRVGALPLQGVTPDRLSALYRELLERGGQGGAALSASTVRRVHGTLHRALRDAWGYTTRNTASAAAKPRVPGPGHSPQV